jgi:hypothetical protein
MVETQGCPSPAKVKPWILEVGGGGEEDWGIKPSVGNPGRPDHETKVREEFQWGKS